MSGFSSLLHQFKQTTERARAPPAPSHRAMNTNSATSSSKPSTKTTYHPPCTPVRRIFIACPLVETGGPEALHQLCHMINSGAYQYSYEEEENIKSSKASVDEFGREIKRAHDGNAVRKGTVKAYMLYLRERHNAVHVVEGATRPKKYNLYDAPPATALPGEGDDCTIGKDGYCSDLVVWPEIWTKFMDALQPTKERCDDNEKDSVKSKKYQSAIWWLSVDNNRGAFGPKDFRDRCDVLHLVQSAYARQYIHSSLVGGKRETPMKKHAGVLDLTEFIPYATSLSFSRSSTGDETSETVATTSTHHARDLDVVYNPAKGIHYTNEIIRRATTKKAKGIDGGAVASSCIQFHPIGKGEGVKSVLYIDFGHHPGMDRLPREATLAGCVVLTNREGAANFDKDVPLPKEFKFSSFDIGEIYAMLKDCCCDSKKYEEYVKKMQPYRDWILGQEHRMRICIDKLIEEIVSKRSLGKAACHLSQSTVTPSY
eukprot:CCRYP_017001-RB/>CCRYP_017001-RB protein AED:0.02 eAED:0.02 QI:0/0/0.5/1/0/0/2/6193/483